MQESTRLYETTTSCRMQYELFIHCHSYFNYIDFESTKQRKIFSSLFTLNDQKLCKLDLQSVSKKKSSFKDIPRRHIHFHFGFHCHQHCQQHFFDSLELYLRNQFVHHSLACTCTVNVICSQSMVKSQKHVCKCQVAWVEHSLYHEK